MIGLVQLRSTTAVWRDEQRPYVVADFESSPTHVTLIDFVLRNIGRTAAFNVRIEWDDPQPLESRVVPGYQFTKLAIFNRAIPVVPPGREYRAFFDALKERFPNAELPNVYTVALSYTDRRGESYSERYVLDLNLWRVPTA